MVIHLNGHIDIRQCRKLNYQAEYENVYIAVTHNTHGEQDLHKPKGCTFRPHAIFRPSQQLMVFAVAHGCEWAKIIDLYADPNPVRSPPALD